MLILQLADKQLKFVKYLKVLFIMKTLSINYQTDFEISFSSTFDTFEILYIFHVLVMGKLDLRHSLVTNIEHVLSVGVCVREGSIS